MMKASLRKIPFVGLACECARQIYVDKSSPSALRRTMERAENQLRGGMSLVVFPEGARTPDGRMHRFRRGAFLLADEFKLPVVPTTSAACSVLSPTRTTTYSCQKPVVASQSIAASREENRQSRYAADERRIHAKPTQKRRPVAISYELLIWVTIEHRTRPFDFCRHLNATSFRRLSGRRNNEHLGFDGDSAASYLNSPKRD